MAGFDDVFGQFGDLFGGNASGANPPADIKKKEKGLPWEAKSIDGKLYVPLEQVVELLAQNDVLPAVRKGLENHLKK